MSDWKSDMKGFFQEKQKKGQVDGDKLKETKSEVARFFSAAVIPAFEEIKTELEKYQREGNVVGGIDSASIVISYKGYTEFTYSIKVHPGTQFPYSEIHFRNPSEAKTYRAEGILRTGSQDCTIAQITKEEIIKHFLSDYKNHML
jgi:hypothetical protein